MSLGNIFSFSIPVVGNGQLSFQHFYISLSRNNFLTSWFFLFQYKKSHSNSSRVLPTGPEKVRLPQRLLIPSPPLNGANKNTSTPVKTSQFKPLYESYTVLCVIFVAPFLKKVPTFAMAEKQEKSPLSSILIDYASISKSVEDPDVPVLSIEKTMQIFDSALNEKLESAEIPSTSISSIDHKSTSIELIEHSNAPDPSTEKAVEIPDSALAEKPSASISLIHELTENINGPNLNTEKAMEIPDVVIAEELEKFPSRSISSIDCQSTVIELEQPDVPHRNTEKASNVPDHTNYRDKNKDYEDSSDDSSDSFMEEMHRNAFKPTEKIPALVTKEFSVLGYDLPPVEDLHIVPEKELCKIGVILSIVEICVVVDSYNDAPALNAETILFLSTDKPLGKIFEVWGRVTHPLYSVRFNSVEHIKEKDIIIGADVFYSPEETELTNYVMVSELLKEKGSDASWKDNQEPPEECLEYSDDDMERHANKKRRHKKRHDNGNPLAILFCENQVKSFDQKRFAPSRENISQRNNFNCSDQYSRTHHMNRQNESASLNSVSSSTHRNIVQDSMSEIQSWTPPPSLFGCLNLAEYKDSSNWKLPLKKENHKSTSFRNPMILNQSNSQISAMQGRSHDSPPVFPPFELFQSRLPPTSSFGSVQQNLMSSNDNFAYMHQNFRLPNYTFGFNPNLRPPNYTFESNPNLGVLNHTVGPTHLNPAIPNHVVGSVQTRFSNIQHHQQMDQVNYNHASPYNNRSPQPLSRPFHSVSSQFYRPVHTDPASSSANSQNFVSTQGFTLPPRPPPAYQNQTFQFRSESVNMHPDYPSVLHTTVAASVTSPPPNHMTFQQQFPLQLRPPAPILFPPMLNNIPNQSPHTTAASSVTSPPPNHMTFEQQFPVQPRSQAPISFPPMLNNIPNLSPWKNFRNF
ncbi:hypothetical protein CDAR_269851 [Caerostris darwini]|uniref:H/ACA ribonucleoprotein complex non-core subunit NAF1 n=1 Tax=Caerostris darwini TaxID=1538125 RepID=A0AAV4RKS4_9ARAC|nr:hypothetical protein CDAR_269851 [Caerostris darwini]